MSDEITMLEIEIGKQIKALRALKGWSQTDLAEASGLGQGRISNLENGKSQSVENLKLVSDALGLTMAELVAAAEARVQGAA